MKMGRLEKRLVNRESKARSNIALLQQRLDEMDRGSIRDVLELGCGVGYVSSHLSKTYKMNVIGTDLDPDQIANARRLHGAGDLLQFQVEDASHMGFADNSFDLVISQHVFHHMAAWQMAVQEIARVLRQGGHLIWLDFALPAFLKSLLRPWHGKYGIYSIGEVRAEMQRHGLHQRFHEALIRGPLVHHHMVLQKA